MNLEKIIPDFSHWEVYFIITIGLFAMFLAAKAFTFFRKGRAEGSILTSVILANLKLPLLFFITILSAYLSIYITFYNLEGSAARMVKQILPTIVDTKNISLTLIAAWYTLRVLSGIRKYFQQHTQRLNISIFSKILQAIVIFSAALFIIDELGLNISGIVTFGGIGGIAAGLAAKDLLANFFGSLVITLDRPFVVGDRIFSPDKQISGLVMEIGWRLTKVMTYEKRPIYIPNSLFATIIVQNDSRMSHRRINDMLRVRFEEVEIVSTIVEEVEKMLGEHLGVDKKQSVLASIDSIGSKIFTLHIYAFAKTTEWGKYKVIRQDILIQIVKIVNSVGASLVFPEATVEVHEKELYTALAQGDKFV